MTESESHKFGSGRALVGYFGQLVDYWYMPGTIKPEKPNLAPFIFESFYKDFIGQVKNVDIDSPQFAPLVYIFTSGPGNGKSNALTATAVFLGENADRIYKESKGITTAESLVRVASHDYRYSLVKTMKIGKIEDNRDRYHTKQDYDEINPILWQDIEDLLDWREDGRRKNHILVLEVPRTTRLERTGPVLEKLAQLNNEGKIKAKIIFSQGSPVVRQLALLKRSAIRSTLDMDLPQAQLIFEEWGLNAPQNDDEKRAGAIDGAPIWQMVHWNNDIDNGTALWFTQGGIAIPFLKNRVIKDIDEFRQEILIPSWYFRHRRDLEVDDLVFASGLFGSSELGSLMFRDLAVGMEADYTLGNLFGDNRIIVLDAPRLGRLVRADAQKFEPNKLGLRPALRIIRGIDRIHGMSVGEYTTLIRDKGQDWLDEPTLGLAA